MAPGFRGGVSLVGVVCPKDGWLNKLPLHAKPEVDLGIGDILHDVDMLL